MNAFQHRERGRSLNLSDNNVGMLGTVKTLQPYENISIDPPRDRLGDDGEQADSWHQNDQADSRDHPES
jgi:hypothetical protein